MAIDGDTAIIGSVLDDDGGTDSGSAYVYSIAPELAIQNLIANVDALASAGTLKRGQANGLTRPLENALRSLSRDGTEAACNQLTDFMTEVGLKTPEPLPQVEADAILASADSIRDALGCSAF